MIGKIQDVVAASVVISAPTSTESAAASVAPAAESDKLSALSKPAEAQSSSPLSNMQAAQADEKAAAAEDKKSKAMDENTVSRMTEELNDLMNKINCDLEFSYSKEADMLSVKMTDKRTGEVLKEYPPEDLIKGMINAREWIGAFIDRNA